MNFGQAIGLLKAGFAVTRKGWNGNGLWLELQRPDANSKMTLPYIFICYPDDAKTNPDDAKTTPGARVPWLASQTDMLADDWSVHGSLSEQTKPQPAPSTGPRITPQDIEEAISSEHYFTADQGVDGASYRIHDPNKKGPLSLLTFCVLVLKNGFTVTGESACVSPENFDAIIGRQIARQNAVAKVWPLMGYALKDTMYWSGR